MKYKDVGVDIERAERIVDDIKKIVKPTLTKDVISGIGGFGAGYLLPKGYNEPVLVSSTDGVGTKLKIAQMMNVHDTVGIDLVAMCVNDTITMGAKPLFFLDYIATGKLDEGVVKKLVTGIAKGCELSECSLVGGETAEMPNFYPDGEYDLAGFVVGVVERKSMITGKDIRNGDVVLGLASSGVHSNGYSLVRKLFFEKLGLNVDDYVPELKSKLGDVLIEPTKIYVKSIMSLIKKVKVKGIAHITGGGIPGNLSRVLPNNLDAVIDKDKWKIPKIFSYMMNRGKISEDEMFKTFNMGIGMCVVVSAEDEGVSIKTLRNSGEKVYRIGRIEKGNGLVRIV